VDRSSASPKKGWDAVRWRVRNLGRGLDLLPEKCLLFDFKMEHFGAVFKLDITRNKDAIARGGGLTLATPMVNMYAGNVLRFLTSDDLKL